MNYNAQINIIRPNILNRKVPNSAKFEKLNQTELGACSKVKFKL